MILDKQNLMSEDQAVTVSAASTNVIDLGAVDATAPTPNLRLGHLGRVLVQVTADFATCTSIAAKVQVSADAAFTAPKDVISGGAVAVASALAGKKLLDVQLPEEADLRYLRVYYTVAGSAATAGTVVAAITRDQDVG